MRVKRKFLFSSPLYPSPAPRAESHFIGVPPFTDGGLVHGLLTLGFFFNESFTAIIGAITFSSFPLPRFASHCSLTVRMLMLSTLSVIDR